ncbi:unannotated protein [freshwater metagenome]|uniref:Unannotated protein n=1 Tax=freshwater metagenome TaxID=449393 RepID=A0A6J6SQL9_9ZZZZ
MGDSGDGDIGLVGAALIEHPGVDRAADRAVDVGGAQPLQQCRRVATRYEELAEGGLLEDRHGLAGRPLLGIDPGDPVLLAPRVVDGRAFALRRKEVRTLPAHARAEGGARLLDEVMDGRAPEGPRRLELAIGPRHGVVQTEHLADARAKPLVVAVERREPPDIDADKIGRRLAADDPLGECAPGATRRGDADGVEARGDEEVLDLRGPAEDELVIGREAFRAVVELLDAGLLEHGHPVQRALHEDLEVVPVLVQQLELERVRELVGRDPGLRHRLEPADDEPADLLLHIGVAVGVAEDRHHPIDALDLVGHDVEVLGGVQRHVHAGHRADGLRPLPRAVHDDAGLDVALIGADAGDGATRHRHADNPGALEDPGPELARSAGEGLRDIGRVRRAVARQPDRALQITGLENRDALEGLRWREDLALEVEGLGGRGSAQQLHHSLGGSGDRDAAALLVAGAQARLGLK